MMSNKKDCKAQDAPNDTKLVFFEVVLSDFESPSYIVKTLREDWSDQLTDHVNWDASNPEIMSKGRTAKWLSNTWYDYVQPKYRKYLGRWNKRPEAVMDSPCLSKITVVAMIHGWHGYSA
jgi:hypothetical protein